MSSTVCRSKVERLITLSTSAVAVCCCRYSRSSFSSRVFSMAMTACAAKFCTSSTCLSADPIEPGALRVIDGDTIEAAGAVVRLVGFDTPEPGRRAQCSIEAERGELASARLGKPTQLSFDYGNEEAEDDGKHHSRPTVDM